MAFTNSGLVNYTNISPFRNSPRTQSTITKIVVHHMAGILTMEQFDTIVHTPNRNMSSNYAIDCNGKIGLFCPEADRSWCSSSPWMDNQAVTIETSNCSLAPNWEVSATVYERLVALCTDICKRNNIPKLVFTGTTSGSLCFHYMTAQTECPGPWIKARANDLCNRVNANLGNPSYVTPTAYSISDSTTTAFQYAQTGDYSLNPDYTQINSYIVSVDRFTSSIDTDKLNDLKVIAMFIEAGCLYDKSHVEVKSYVNPKLDIQVKTAKDGNINYGLFAYVRSRSLAEATEELKWLRIYIQKYVPPFGVWLKLELTSSKPTNDSIVAKYKAILTRSGLKGKMGFYVTREQLDKISWDKWQEDFLLWLVDPVEDITEIEQILDPTFFDL